MTRARFFCGTAALVAILTSAAAACVGDPPATPSDAGAGDSAANETSTSVDAGSGFCAQELASDAHVVTCSDFDEGNPTAAGWNGIQLTGGVTAMAQATHPFSPPDALTILAPQSATPVAGILYLAQVESQNTFDAKLHLRAWVGASCVLADAGQANYDAGIVLARYDFYASGDVVYRVDVLASPPTTSFTKLTLALQTYVAEADGGLVAAEAYDQPDSITPETYFAVDFEFHTGSGSPKGTLTGQNVTLPAAQIGGQPLVAVGLNASHTASTCEVDVDDVALTSL